MVHRTGSIPVVAQCISSWNAERMENMASRQLYRGIATNVAQCLGNSGTCKDSVAELARKIADTLKADRSQFRYDTFFAACGLDSFGYVKGTVHTNS